MKPGFSIVGCGRVGVTLARILKEKGYPLLGLASRSQASLKTAAEILKPEYTSLNAEEVTREADLVIIATPDDTIGAVCDAIAEKNRFKKDSIILHCSGALPSTILNSAKSCGAIIGSFHPLQSIAQINLDTNPFRGIITAVEGEAPAMDLGRQMAGDLGSEFLKLNTSGKALYHAAAVVASNYLVTLVDAACRLMAGSGVDEAEAYKVLSPLMKGSFKNIDRLGVPDALTGPVVRGDYQVVATHIREIEDQLPELADFYKLMGRHTVDVANAQGSLSRQQADMLTRVFTGKTGDEKD